MAYCMELVLLVTPSDLQPKSEALYSAACDVAPTNKNNNKKAILFIALGLINVNVLGVVENILFLLFGLRFLKPQSGPRPSG